MASGEALASGEGLESGVLLAAGTAGWLERFALGTAAVATATAVMTRRATSPRARPPIRFLIVVVLLGFEWGRRSPWRPVRQAPANRGLNLGKGCTGAGSGPLPWRLVSTSDSDRPRVLFVEDERSIPSRSRARSRARASSPVVGARRPREALDAAARGEPDLVLLDLRLPDGDGRDVCRELRATSDVPIDHAHRARHGDRPRRRPRARRRRLRRQAVLAAPRSIARIRAVLRRTRAAPRAPRRPPAAVTRRRARRSTGRPARAPRRRGAAAQPQGVRPARASWSRTPAAVVTREDLMARVWDENWFGSTKTLDVHVGWLRRKLGDEPADPRFIHTVRGVGFRFAAPTRRLSRKPARAPAAGARVRAAAGDRRARGAAGAQRARPRRRRGHARRRAARPTSSRAAADCWPADRARGAAGRAAAAARPRPGDRRRRARARCSPTARARPARGADYGDRPEIAGALRGERSRTSASADARPDDLATAAPVAAARPGRPAPCGSRRASTRCTAPSRRATLGLALIGAAGARARPRRRAR